MNIKRAKQEIQDAIEAYLAKDEFGQYRIPEFRQRPVLLMGPPGIGKTQIMEQIAKEMHLALVAYTITHHTRQSAVGLPVIRERVYGGETCSVTEYTMSEIIASVYDKMEQTGLKEGILFVDEINCVSETLAPTMLQFLQYKTFGNRKVPAGWIIAAAGNPPEYNKSVREFDVVTLDRLKYIAVEPDFAVWKEYAYREGIHPAVIAYLDLRRENFCRIENTADGKRYATPRGWEDLSRLIVVYEKLGKTVDRDVVIQYIRHEKAAKDFANYLALYYKYRTDYHADDILNGRWDAGTRKKIRSAPLDEHLNVISLLSGKLGDLFAACFHADEYTALLHRYLTILRDGEGQVTPADLAKMAADDLERGRKQELLTRDQERAQMRAVQALEEFLAGAGETGIIAAGEGREKGSAMLGPAAETAAAKETQRYTCGETGGESTAAAPGSADESESARIWAKTGKAAASPAWEADLARARALLAQETGKLDVQAARVSEALDNVFCFLEDAFGDSQEMVAFVTELNANYYSVWFIREYGSDRYYRHNKGLLFDRRQKSILAEMELYES